MQRFLSHFQDKVTKLERAVSLFFSYKWCRRWFLSTNIKDGLYLQMSKFKLQLLSMDNDTFPRILERDNSPVQHHLLLSIMDHGLCKYFRKDSSVHGSVTVDTGRVRQIISGTRTELLKVQLGLRWHSLTASQPWQGRVYHYTGFFLWLLSQLLVFNSKQNNLYYNFQSHSITVEHKNQSCYSAFTHHLKLPKVPNICNWSQFSTWRLKYLEK
jgi:hypothetical protein